LPEIKHVTLKKIFPAFLLLLLTSYGFAQQATLKGTVTDANNKDALIGASVIYQEGKGVSTDIDGNYELTLEPGNYNIRFSYIGYFTVSKSVELKAGEVKVMNIGLQEEVDSLETIVVTGSIFEKRASEEVISIEVIKPDFINKINPVKFDDIARRVTGLNVVDGQANIRAGSGWAYGVGSRVMVIVDGQPMLSPERFDVKWNFLPFENIGQIEVLKGASSVLYGSSAMNGTINIQSIKPTSTPYNKLVAYTGFIGSPKRDITKWWRSPRLTNGVYFTRAYKPRDNFEYNVGANMYNSQQHFADGEERVIRANFNTRWFVNERFSVGVRGNAMYTYESEFFWWQNGEGGALRPADGSLNTQEYIRVTIDPYLVKFSKKGVKHDFKNRIYINRPEFADKPYFLINSDYQVSKKWESNWSLIGGVNTQTFYMNEKDWGGDLSGNFVAGYAQAEKKWNKIAIVAGTRVEFFRIQDTKGIAAAPIKNESGDIKFTSPGNWRLGFNYNPFKNTFFRGNWGQAFRFPSIAERYANASISIVNVYPNPDLKPEYGWTSELGIEQRFATKSKRFSGSFDAAFFWQEYNDLVEFLFDFYIPDSVAESGVDYDPFDYAGFKSVNVSKARIAGYELTWKSNLNLNGHSFNMNLGYSYSYPVDLNADISGRLGNVGVYLGKLFRSNFKSAEKVLADPSLSQALLKYRNRHLLTTDIEWNYKGFSVGFDIRYYSFIEKVDDIFGVFIPDLLDYRFMENFKGNMVVGARAFYQLNKNHNIGIIVRNLTNNEYYLRPPRLESPVNYSFQYRYEF
jgi:outer membrane receptor protein involved in Fe transport